MNLSHKRFHNENYETIYRIFEKNNYPPDLINKIIKETIFEVKRKMQSISNNNTNNTTNNNTQNQHVPTENAHNSISEEQNHIRLEGSRTIYKSITYVPKLAENLKKKITKINKNLKIAFKPKNQLRKHYTQLKDDIKKEEKSAVIYKVDCEDCGKSYIGQTCRKLKDRMNDHKGYIAKKSPCSGLAAHAINENHQFNFEIVKINDTENNRKKRETTETIQIYQQKSHTVNIKQDAEGFKKVYARIVNYNV